MQTLTLPSRSFLRAASSPLSSPRLRVLLFVCSSFSSSSSSSSSSRRRPSLHTKSERQQNSCDDESKAIKVSVWWDYENCSIPIGVNVYRVANRIVSALRYSGIHGPVSINAFGDTSLIPRSTQEALISTGIRLTHTPQSGKNSADRLLMADLIGWTTQNPPPAHFFLISSDSDFATILNRLRMCNYNVLLSCVDRAKPSLYSASTLMWSWVELVKGKNFTPQQFNHPPDGVYGSWYGHRKGCLTDPFEETHDLMDRVVNMNTDAQKSVSDGIRQILQVYPDGIPLSVLDFKLKQKNIHYGHMGFKKLSSLVNSLGDILTLIPAPDGKNEPFVVLTRKRSAKRVNEPVEPPGMKKSAEPAEQDEPQQVAMESAAVTQSQESESIQQVELPTEHEPEPEPEPVKPVNTSLDLDSQKRDQVNDLNKGIFGIFRKVLTGRENSKDSIPVVVECEDKLTENNQTYETKDKHGLIDRGLFRKIGRWLGFGREEGCSNLFADQKFWSDVESFLTSSEGADLVAKSRTREELMQGLYKVEMLSLRSLEESNLIKLVDLLISEKKWIQENTSSTFPFILSIPSTSTSITDQENLSEPITNLDQLSLKKAPSKTQILSDCHILVKEMLDEKPEGFRIGWFKPRFENKFGYMLVNRRMGYPKLVSLLQTIPGIRIDLLKNMVYKNDEEGKKTEANYIGEVVADSKEDDSVFDELGPVSEETDLDYREPSLSDEEFSDESETEVSPDFNRETRKDQSSLIKILDTFASSKDRDAIKKASLGLDGIVDCSRKYENFKSEGDAIKKASLGLDGIVDCSRKYENFKSEGDARNARRLRSKGPYKFVADEVEDDKEKIVDSILGSLKKIGDPSILVERKDA